MHSHSPSSGTAISPPWAGCPKRRAARASNTARRPVEHASHPRLCAHRRPGPAARAAGARFAWRYPAARSPAPRPRPRPLRRIWSMREGQSLSPALARASRLGGTRPAGRREGRGGTSSLRVVLHLVSAQGRRGRTRRRGDSDLQVVAKWSKDSGFSRAPSRER